MADDWSDVGTNRGSGPTWSDAGTSWNSFTYQQSQVNVLGYGMLNSPADDLSDIDHALAQATTGAYVRLYLTLPHSWKADSLIQTMGLRRVSDQVMAYDWKYDGSGLTSTQRILIQKLLSKQLKNDENANWELDQLPGIPSQGGTSTMAPTSPPFGLGSNNAGWPNPPNINMPNIKIDIPTPVIIGISILGIIFILESMN